MKIITSKVTLSVAALITLCLSLGFGGASLTVYASAAAERAAGKECAKIAGKGPDFDQLRAACRKGFVAGYDGGNKTNTCKGLAADRKATCEKSFDKGKVAKSGSTSAGSTACADPKSVDPECTEPKALNLTDEQARLAGLSPKSTDSLISQTLNGVYTIVAIVAVIVIVLAGIRITIADGDASKVAAARQTIIYAVVGLVIVGSAFIITGIVQGIGNR